MIRIKDPWQMEMFDRFSELLSPAAYRRIKEGWLGCFRECILYLLLEVAEKIRQGIFKVAQSRNQGAVFYGGIDGD